MPREIKIHIELTEPDWVACRQAISSLPNGVEFLPDGLVRHHQIRTEIVGFILVIANLVRPMLTEAATDAAKELLKEQTKEWLIKFITKLKAQCIRIQGHEPKDAADLERIISEQIEIGKND